eukprot:m.52484 g.52484  ORF g.52484 m.52484 type:complete len:988 (+) comp18285_c0_seq1:31-2994(+)
MAQTATPFPSDNLLHDCSDLPPDLSALLNDPIGLPPTPPRSPPDVFPHLSEDFMNAKPSPFLIDFKASSVDPSPEEILRHVRIQQLLGQSMGSGTSLGAPSQDVPLHMSLAREPVLMDLHVQPSSSHQLEVQRLLQAASGTDGLPLLHATPPPSSGAPSSTSNTDAGPFTVSDSALAAARSNSTSKSTIPESFTANSPSSISSSNSIPMPLPMAGLEGESLESDEKPAMSKSSTKPKTREKKTAHNAIERKYRNSINDKIQEMKDSIPSSFFGANAKTNKASVLKKGIDYIRFLEKQRGRIVQENETLKQEVQHLKETLEKLQNNKLGSKVVMCLFLFGLFNFASPFGDGEGADDFNDASSHAGARVLNSVQEDSQSPLSLWLNVWLWMCSLGVWWFVRAAFCLVLAFVMVFRREAEAPSPNALRLAEHFDKKAAAALHECNFVMARSSIIQALETLDMNIPTSSIHLFFGICAQAFYQLLQALCLGVWVNSLLSWVITPPPALAAGLFHRLHQILLEEQAAQEEEKPKTTLPEPSSDVEDVEDDSAQTHSCPSSSTADASGDAGSALEQQRLSPLLSMWVCLRALNIMEATAPEQNALIRMQVYAAMATQLQVTLSGRVFMLCAFYLRLARQAYHQCCEQAGYLSWLFHPDGAAFFRHGVWKGRHPASVENDKEARTISPRVSASLPQLGAAFRMQVLDGAVWSFVTDGNTVSTFQRLQDLRQFSVQAKDKNHEWWALIGLVATLWRQGKHSQARRTFVEVDALKLDQSHLQQTVYSAFRAQQALLDGDHQLCWKACRRTSTLLSDTQTLNSTAFLFRAAKLIALRQLMSTQVALYRLRRYLGGMAEPHGASLPPLVSLTVPSESLGLNAILDDIQKDLRLLRSAGDEFVYAEPCVFMFEAIIRSLVGGKVALTEHLFNKALKAARRLRLRYDEASIQLQYCTYLRSSLSAYALRDHLQKAGTLFKQLDCNDDLIASRKLLKVVNA